MKRANAKLRRELKNMSKELTKIIEKNQYKYSKEPRKREVVFNKSSLPLIYTPNPSKRNVDKRNQNCKKVIKASKEQRGGI